MFTDRLPKKKKKKKACIYSFENISSKCFLKLEIVSYLIMAISELVTAHQSTALDIMIKKKKEDNFAPFGGLDCTSIESFDRSLLI